MSFVKNDNRSGHQTMHPSSSAPVLSTDEKWALPARAEAATRSTATVLETSIAPRMTALKGTTGQSALGEEKETINLLRNETSKGLAADQLIDTTITLRTCMAKMYEQFVAIWQNFTGPFYY